MGKEPLTLRELSDSAEYTNAWKVLIEKPLTYEEFSHLPMPQGFEARELWHHFSLLRRYAGIEFAVKPWFETLCDVSWASITKSTERDFDNIAVLANPGSPLNASIDDPSFSLEVTPYVLQEVSTACRRDGIKIDEDTLRSIWSGETSPHSLNEIALANLAGIFNHLDLYTKRTISVTQLERIHEDLIDGIGELEHLKPYRNFGAKLLRKERVSDREFVETTVHDAIVAAKNAHSVPDCLVSFYETSSALWDLGYFPSLNSLTELAYRWVFFRKNEMPVLGIVPLSYLSSKESNRYDKTFTNEFSDISIRVGSDEGIDCTIMFAGMVSTVLDGLQDIDKTIGSLMTQIEKSEQEFNSIQDLNRRQKDLLIIFSRYPDMTIRVKSYADLFGVVRATARNDLLAMVTKGYLLVTKDERAAVFSLNKDR